MFQDESKFVQWLRTLPTTRSRRLKVGIGDDAALVSLGRGRELILTSDFSIEGVHFTREIHPPRAVGHRSLARSLSDVAAMGGVPRFALVSLAISSKTTRPWVERFYAGLTVLAKKFGVALAGGDTARSSGRMAVDVVAVGEVERGRAVLRSGAKPGDRIYVSGTLGLSALGLRLLRRGVPSLRHKATARAPQARQSYPRKAAIQAHLFPEPRCALGRFLATQRLPSALIDVSDGLSTDLARLCQASGVGARIWADRLPRPGKAVAPSRSNALELALDGGEDYELLFTVPPGKAVPRRFRGVELHSIGEIQPGRKLVLVATNGKEDLLEPGGYDHFRRR